MIKRQKIQKSPVNHQENEDDRQQHALNQLLMLDA
jgi:hypothetical protein